MEYSAELRQRFMALERARDNSRGAGLLLVGAAEDRSLAVWVRFEVQVQNRQIGWVRYRAFGCPHTLAAAEQLAESLEGQPLDALLTVDWQALARAIGMPREKFGKLLRFEDALRACHTEAMRKTEN